jgi:hypothetical protein
MSVRTAQAIKVGGFYSTVGRGNGRLGACEETELAIRLSASIPGSAVLYVPDAAVDHNVGAERTKFTYFLRRCWSEGRSKATVVRLAGFREGLSSERRHVASVLPRSMVSELRKFVLGDLGALLRTCVIMVGLAVAVSGFVAGLPGQSRARRATTGLHSSHRRTS